MNNIQVRHSLGETSIEKETGTEKFMLTSNGAYFYHNPASKYRGLFFPQKFNDYLTLYKTIDLVEPSSKITKIIANGSKTILETEKGNLSFQFTNQVLSIESDYSAELKFTLDMREIYDFSDKGRIYNVYYESGFVIVEYKKFSDNVLENLSYKHFLVIKSDCRFDKIDNWREQKYPEDESRRSAPYSLFVYEAFKLQGKHFLITFSEDKEKAIQKLRSYLPKYETYQIDIKGSNEQKIAYACAKKAIEELYVDTVDIFGHYAGLPWFFQFWTRDEGISAKSLLITKKFDLAKKILLSRIRDIAEDGRLSNRYPYSELGTADGTAWIFKRIYDMIKYFQDNNMPMEEYLSQNDFNYIREQLKKSIERQKSKYVTGNLVKNNPNETWMDTSWEDDTRSGFRIEIQALWLSMLNFLNFLDRYNNKNAEFEELEQACKEEVKKIFFDGKILKDGKDDATIRPNIFLAHYLYPDLLSKEEWETVFDNSLPKLWLDWGGLATIQKDSRLFCSNYTGENNQSYHRGDSWFFLNNIAAICLSELNKEKYSHYVNKIISASTEDILYKGIIARPSELSSASEQKAEGSLFQLWSASTFIEIMSISCQKS